MPGISFVNYENYNMGFSAPPTEEQLKQVVNLIHQPGIHRKEVLGGRGKIVLGSLSQCGEVVVKQFTRGGLISMLIKSWYFKWGKNRAKVEFDLLRAALDLGISVPEPICFVVEGDFIYRAWLITKRISDHHNLADISLNNPDRARKLMKEVSQQVDILIQNKILHIDFHPGNVLVDAEDNIYLIDFDKAHFHYGTKREVRDKYLTRWRRAVIKHQLPEVLSEYMCSGLRKHFEE